MTSSSLVAIFATRCKRTLTAVCKRGACAASTRRVAISFFFAGPSFIVVSRQTQRAGAEEIRRNRDGDEARPASLLSLFLAAGPRKVSWTDGKSKRDVDVIPLPIYLYHSHNGPSQKRANKKKKYKICAVVTGCVLALTLSVSSQTSLMTARPSPHSAPCCCPPNEMTWRLRKG